MAQSKPPGRHLLSLLAIAATVAGWFAIAADGESEADADGRAPSRHAVARRGHEEGPRRRVGPPSRLAPLSTPHLDPREPREAPLARDVEPERTPRSVRGRRPTPLARTRSSR